MHCRMRLQHESEGLPRLSSTRRQEGRRAHEQVTASLRIIDQIGRCRRDWIRCARGLAHGTRERRDDADEAYQDESCSMARSSSIALNLVRCSNTSCVSTALNGAGRTTWLEVKKPLARLRTTAISRPWRCPSMHTRQH